MKNQLNQRIQSVLLATIVAIFLLCASASIFAQTGTGAKYGTRDLTTCTDTKSPTKGAITATLAAQYARCSYEKADREDINLLEDLKIEVGGAIPYNPRNFPYATDINPQAPVYPLRANFRNYLCAPVTDDARWGNRGKNCTVYVSQKATGVCLKTTFGDWRCSITDFNPDKTLTEYNMPPPGGGAKAVAAKDKPTPAVAAAKDTRQIDVTAKDAADENKDASGFPKPDFSELEKWYEITKYEYGDITADFGNRLYFWFKPKADSRPVSFYVEYRDKDGALVQFGQQSVSGAIGTTKAGEVGKAEAGTPYEKEMGRVVSVKFIRIKQ